MFICSDRPRINRRRPPRSPSRDLPPQHLCQSFRHPVQSQLSSRLQAMDRHGISWWRIMSRFGTPSSIQSAEILLTRTLPSSNPDPSPKPTSPLSANRSSSASNTCTKKENCIEISKQLISSYLSPERSNLPILVSQPSSSTSGRYVIPLLGHLFGWRQKSSNSRGMTLKQMFGP